MFFRSGAALLLLLPLLISALVLFILGWRERAAWRALRGELLRGAHPTLALSNASVDANTLPLTAEDAGDEKKRAITAQHATAYRDSASQELADRGGLAVGCEHDVFPTSRARARRAR